MKIFTVNVSERGVQPFKLPSGSVVTFEPNDTQDDIQSYYEGVSKGVKLILDKNSVSFIYDNAEDSYLTKWKLRNGVILRIEDGTIFEFGIKTIIRRMLDNSLELSSVIPTEIVKLVVKEISTRRSTLFLDDNTPIDSIIEATKGLTKDSILELSTNNSLEILRSVAQGLNLGVMLKLRGSNIPTENIKLIAANIKKGRGLKLNSEMLVSTIEAAAGALTRDAILQFDSDLTPDIVSRGIKALKPGRLFMLTKFAGARLIDNVIESCPDGVKIIMAPSFSGTYFERVAPKMKKGGGFYLDLGTELHKAKCIYDGVQSGVVIEDRTGINGPKITVKQNEIQPVVTEQQMVVDTPFNSQILAPTARVKRNSSINHSKCRDKAPRAAELFLEQGEPHIFQNARPESDDGKRKKMCLSEGIILIPPRCALAHSAHDLEYASRALKSSMLPNTCFFNNTSAYRDVTLKTKDDLSLLPMSHVENVTLLPPSQVFSENGKVQASPLVEEDHIGSIIFSS